MATNPQFGTLGQLQQFTTNPYSIDPALYKYYNTTAQQQQMIQGVSSGTWDQPGGGRQYNLTDPTTGKPIVQTGQLGSELTVTDPSKVTYNKELGYVTPTTNLTQHEDFLSKYGWAIPILAAGGIVAATGGSGTFGTTAASGAGAGEAAGGAAATTGDVAAGGAAAGSTTQQAMLAAQYQSLGYSQTVANQLAAMDIASASGAGGSELAVAGGALDTMGTASNALRLANTAKSIMGGGQQTPTASQGVAQANQNPMGNMFNILNSQLLMGTSKMLEQENVDWDAQYKKWYDTFVAGG